MVYYLHDQRGWDIHNKPFALFQREFFTETYLNK
jgi:hypothetical protein